MKIFKKVVLIHLLMLLIQVCTTQNSQAPNKSTFKSFDVNYASAGVDVSKEENVQFQNGTNIKVPVDAFVDASGKTVKGKVDIEYRELKNASEIVASGIPTNYSNSKKQQFETEGVIEVRAKSNGKDVYLAKNKNLEINLPKNIKAGENLYHLEESGEQSSYLRSPFITQAYAQNVGDSRKWVLVYEGSKVQAGPDKKTPKDTTDTPDKTKEGNNEDGTFSLKLNLQVSPELAKYKDTRWKFAGKKDKNNPTTEENKWVLNETWDALELVQNLFAPNVVLKGHSKAVATAVFSPDGSYLITASSDYTAKIWSVTGRLITTLKGHKDFIRTAVFSKNNQYIVTASGDGTAKIWTKDGTLVRTLEGKKNVGIYAANFSPDGSKIVAGLENGTAKIWSLDGQLIKTLQGHKQAVYSVEFSPNGKYILTASADKTAKVWTLDGKVIRDLKKHRKAIFSARFSSDGAKIVTASADKTARIWSLEGKQLHRLKHRKAVYAATFSPNNQYILTASEDNTAKLWDINGNKISTLRSQNSPFSYAVFSPNGRYILTASKDNTAKLWTKPELVPNTPYELELSNSQKVFRTTIQLLQNESKELASNDGKDDEKENAEKPEKGTGQIINSRTIKVSKFGYYSFARPIVDKNSIQIKANFQLDDKKLNNVTIYLISGKHSKEVAKLNRQDWNAFRFTPGNHNRILAVLPDDRVAVFSRKDFKNMPIEKVKKNKAYTFILRKKSKMRSIKALHEILQ
ncbi:hypothetical protein BKI52_01385 [marine bacterium AO1-C]|nr:hypothetical protein BKI52_01385 [marine bacterium AO1-C]